MYRLKTITPREHKESESFDLFFERREDKGSGFAFPCDENGRVDFRALPSDARRNYTYCVTAILHGTEEFLAGVVRKTVRLWSEPEVGECGCGERHVLDGMWEEQIHCSCGQHYNALTGQVERDLRGMSQREIWADELAINPEFLD